MAWLKHSFQPDHLWFTDDIFGLQGEWVEEFAREVAARDASIPFTIQTRADLINEQNVASLARAGCVEAWIGAESGRQKILDLMEKGITTRQIREARELLKVSGIRACFFIIFGYPGETFNDIMATVDMMRETMPDHIGVSVTYPLPGTKLYEMVREQLGPQTNWVDSNDLAMMFQGPYSSSFYRKLHQVVHFDLEVRRRLVAAAGDPDPDLLAAMADLTAAWLELEQLEPQSRTLPSELTTVTREEARR
jgi:anaerobic magnesium-protoporphyrin IX monomethyl ester cyclase